MGKLFRLFKQRVRACIKHAKWVEREKIKIMIHNGKPNY